MEMLRDNNVGIYFIISFSVEYEKSIGELFVTFTIQIYILCTISYFIRMRKISMRVGSLFEGAAVVSRRSTLIESISYLRR